MKVKMKKRYKIMMAIILLVILALIAILIIGKNFSREENNNPKVVDTLNTYDYTLEDRDTELMKETYNELKEILDAKEIDMECYATVLSKLFVIDLFTIDNKRNKYDVGGTEYIYPDAVSNYKANVEDTLYKTVKTNSDGKRKQDLPIVKSVNVDNVEESTFTIQEEKNDAYIITLSWDYEVDLGYDNRATITCIKDDKMVYIVEYKVEE